MAPASLYQDTAPAAPREVTPAINFDLPLKCKFEALEDSTTDGETTDSDLSLSSSLSSLSSLNDNDSPKQRLCCPAPGLLLCAAPATLPAPSLAPLAAAAMLPPPVLSKPVSPLDLEDSPFAASCSKCESQAFYFEVNDFSSSDYSGSIEMVSLGPLRVTLSTDLKMFLKTDSETGFVFVRATCVHLHKDGVAFVTGTLKHSATTASQIKSRLEDLLVDVRVAVDDEPRMVSILGAQLKQGRVTRIFTEFDTGDIYCAVRYKERHNVCSLAHVVAELKDLEVLRRDANLLKYQRQVNSMMIGKMRRRRLGFEAVSQ